MGTKVYRLEIMPVRVPARVMGLLVAGLVLVSADDPQHLPRDPIDPPHPRSETDTSNNFAKPQSASDGQPLYSDELPGFGVGSPRHEGSLNFCRRIAAVLESVPAQDNIKIIVIGTADGLPNDGLSVSLRDLPADCQRAVTLPIRDPDLALLRACGVRIQLAELLNSLPMSIIFDEKTSDIPDGGKSGSEYRLVRVELRKATDNER